METLPLDVWSIICKELTPYDVVSLRTVNKYLYSIFNTKKIIEYDFKFMELIDLNLIKPEYFKYVICFDLRITIGDLNCAKYMNDIYGSPSYVDICAKISEIDADYSGKIKIDLLPNNSLKKLSICGDIGESNHIPNYERLEYLSIIDCFDIYKLPNFPKLKYLEIINNYQINIIPELVHLDTLQITFVDIDIKCIKKCVPNIKKLSYSPNDKFIDAADICHIPYIDINHHDLVDEGISITIINLHLLSNVNYIYLKNVVSDIDCAIFKNVDTFQLEDCTDFYNIHELKNVNNVKISFGACERSNNHLDYYETLDPVIFNDFKNLCIEHCYYTFNWANLVSVGSLYFRYCYFAVKNWNINKINNLTLYNCTNFKINIQTKTLNYLKIYNFNYDNKKTKFNKLKINTLCFAHDTYAKNIRADYLKMFLTYDIDTLVLKGTLNVVIEEMILLFEKIKNIIIIDNEWSKKIPEDILIKYKNVSIKKSYDYYDVFDSLWPKHDYC